MEPRRVLSEKEDILYQTKKHWAVFVKAAIYFGLALLVLGSKGFIQEHVPYTEQYEHAQVEHAQPGKAAAPANPAAVSGQQAAPGTVQPGHAQQDDIKHFLVPAVSWTVTGVCFTAVVVFGLLGLALLLGFFSNKVIITSKRVIQHDVLSGSLSSLDLARVESVRAATGLLGSVLGYGKVILVMGSGQKISIANLRRPHEFERELFGAK